MPKRDPVEPAHRALLNELYPSRAARYAAMRPRYEAGAETLAALAHAFDVNVNTIITVARREGWKKRPRHGVAKSGGEPCPGLTLCPHRRRGVSDLLATARAQIATLTAAPPPADASEAEKAARTLATLTRTLEKVSALDGLKAGNAAAEEVADDVEELRRALLDRLERAERARGAGSLPGGADGQGAEGGA